MSLHRCFAAISALFVAAHGAVAQDEARPQPDEAKRYGVSISGFPVGKVTYEAWRDGRDYQVQAFMGSSGFFGAFIAAKYSGAAAGVVRSGIPRPSAFRGRFQQGRKFADVDVRYSGNRPTKVERFPAADPGPLDVPPARARGALDPISGLYFMLRDRKKSALCTQDFTVYEGAHLARVVTQRAELTEDDAASPIEIVACNGAYVRLEGFPEEVLAEHDSFSFRMEYEPVAGRDTYTLMRFTTQTEFGTAQATRN